jgi:hypothetical protein
MSVDIETPGCLENPETRNSMTSAVTKVKGSDIPSKEMRHTIPTRATNPLSQCYLSSDGRMSCSGLTLGSLLPNPKYPLRDPVRLSRAMAHQIEQEKGLEEGNLVDWQRTFKLPRDENGIVKEIVYRASVHTRKLKTETEDTILADYYHNEDVSMLQDCFLYDCDAYFLSGYWATKELCISQNSIHEDDENKTDNEELWIKDPHTYTWEEEQAFAVILKRVEFQWGGGIKRLHQQPLQLLPQFGIEPENEDNFTGAQFEIRLQDW